LFPILLSSATGFCAGYTAKKGLKLAAIGIGLAAISFLLLELTPLPNAALEGPNARTAALFRRARRLLDPRGWRDALVRALDTDRDGVVSASDLEGHVVRAGNSLHNFGMDAPSTAIFCVGVAIGFSKG
jgi:hypothetical protein